MNYMLYQCISQPILHWLFNQTWVNVYCSIFGSNGYFYSTHPRRVTYLWISESTTLILLMSSRLHDAKRLSEPAILLIGSYINATLAVPDKRQERIIEILSSFFRWIRQEIDLSIKISGQVQPSTSLIVPEGIHLWCKAKCTVTLCIRK